MAEAIIADTDALIDYFAGLRPIAEAVRALLQQRQLVITTVTLFELACGVRTSKQEEDVRKLALACLTIHLTEDAVWKAAEVSRYLRRRGEGLAAPDLLIAGCCLSQGLPDRKSVV